MSQGLTNREAKVALEKYGENVLVQSKHGAGWKLLLGNFANPLVLILLAVAAVSLVLDQVVEAIIVGAMVVMSVGLDFVQEYRASNAAEKLKSRVAPKTVVVREGLEIEIMSRLVVPGDLVVYNAGDLITADGSIVFARDLYLNQSALTGEAFPAEKKEGEMIYAGTSVVSGSAKVVVTATGGHTQFGAIAAKLGEREKVNEFSMGVAKFSATILRIIIIFVVFIFLVNALIKHDLWQSFIFAIAVAVGLTPEFLPMVMTITMSRGSQKMAKKGVIVKKLSAIPTFGSMSILCTDKTGTLTQNHISLVKHQAVDGSDCDEVLRYGYINSSYQTGITNPMDQAVVEYGRQWPLPPKVDEIPFDFERRRMSVVVESSGHLLITKGSYESIISVCESYRQGREIKKLTPSRKREIEEHYEKLSRDGYRVLLIAYKKIPHKLPSYSKIVEEKLILYGFLAFLDPVKPGIRHSLDELENIGIELKVITGDNELVTSKICRDADIEVKGTLVGAQIDKLDEAELYRRAVNTTIFARCSPGQKTRVIQVLRRAGLVVGYMGDGINDAPSLLAADVGISVNNAVDVAKESADFVLTNHDLLELKEGVIEGRRTFGNTMKYVLMGLSSNFGNMFSVLGAVLFLPFLPMLPLQILLNNFLYDLSQMTLPLDEVDHEYIERPKRWEMSHITRFMYTFGPISSIFDFVSFVVLYHFFAHNPAAFQTGWFMESLATQTLVIHVIRTRKLPFIQSSAHPALLLTTLLICSFGWILPMTPIGRYFGLVSLPSLAVGILAGIVVLYLISTEIGKRAYYRAIDRVH